ncbi:MAG: hypothetical protein JWN59_1035 [Sphingomonas bacterium]|nr:hypothetical protein [Sphingomonas bacterium]
MLQALAAQDLRVATIAFRLLVGGVGICRAQAPASGLLVHDALQYAASLRPTARALFGFEDGPAVLAVVPGSPADRAGIAAGDTIRAIDGAPIATGERPEPDRRRPSFAVTADVEARLAQAFDKGAVTLTLARAGGPARIVRIEPVPACRSGVELQPASKRNAWSDGQSVVVTTAMLETTGSDDELAVVIGHEVAHNLLNHRARLDAAGVGKGLFSRIGPKAKQVRESEGEADYLGIYLVARAGYDPAAGAGFWSRYGAAHGDGFLADATHPGWRERVAKLASTASEIAAKRAAGAPLVPTPPIL